LFCYKCVCHSIAPRIASSRATTTIRCCLCRQNLVGSLPRGMPKVIDCRQTGVQATNEMVMQNNTRVYPSLGHRVGVTPYILLCFVIVVSNNVLQARLP
jgi:hypothetical protein